MAQNKGRVIETHKYLYIFSGVISNEHEKSFQIDRISQSLHSFEMTN